ncbi:MAG: nucleoside triphosphate pyrophosphohydrolase [Hyphomicrobiales bacterium]
MQPSRDIERLLEIMVALRTPGTGCPWDLEQTFSSIAPYVIEEAYEVADAIARGDAIDLEEELGDLLFQVVFHSRMAEEQRGFDFGDVVHGITKKMIRRHPHVFGEDAVGTSHDVKAAWERIKAEEKAEKAERKRTLGLDRAHGGGAVGLLDDVPANLPALRQAVKLQQRAGTVGFDWNDVHAVLDKLREETDEIAVEIETGAGHDRLEDELGDVLFVIANLARHLHIDPEQALQRTNGKFRRRFRYIEENLAAAGVTTSDATLAEMEALWQEAKDKV